jgi:apolipoprotein N-acyltransferase
MSVFLTLSSALLLPLSLPNEFLMWGATIPGLVALVPVLIAVYRTPSRVHASRIGMLFGIVSTAVGNYWLAFFGEFSVWTIGGAVLGYAGYNYILFGYLHVLAHPGRTDGGGSRGRRVLERGVAAVSPGEHGMRPVWIAIAWTGYEYLKSVGFLGYPWGLVAYPLAEINVIAQIAEIGGVWGLSFLAAYVNAVIAEAVVSRDTPHRSSGRGGARGHHGAAAALLLAVGATFGAWQLPRLEPVEIRSMLLVQQNVDSWQPGRFTDALARAQDLTLHGMVEAGDTPIDAVVWSETALRRPYRPDDPFFAAEPPVLPFTTFLDLIDVPLITGAPMPAGPEGRDATNSALVITSGGELIGSHGKQQLVPFAESIPFWDVPQVQTFFRERIGIYGTWVPGRETNPLPLPLPDGREVMIGTPICFEDAFGWVPRQMVRNGARLLVNLTNNSWSRQNSAQTQHFVAARLRTIETRTTLVRGTNSGLSSVVDARGRTIETLPMFVGTARRVAVPLYEPRWTLYRAWGDWFGILAAIAAIIRAALPGLARLVGFRS